ncbi:unnamed protein product [Urochloa humidicola]
MGSHEALPDAILELVLLGVDSQLCLLRATATCKRWRRIIASDTFRALHGTPHTIAGSYYKDYSFAVRPRFEPSPSAATINAAHFSLDFVPGPGDDTESTWTVTDSRGSLLLLEREDGDAERSDFIVYEPLTRRHVLIPPLADGYYFSIAVLLDGNGGASIGMTNFRVLCIFQDDSLLHACMFVSGGNSWRRTSIDWRPVLRDIGVAAGRRFWHNKNKRVVALDQNTIEFSSFILPLLDDDVIGCHAILAIGRDSEARIVVQETGSKLKIFARVRGGSGSGSEEE